MSAIKQAGLFASPTACCHAILTAINVACLLPCFQAVLSACQQTFLPYGRLDAHIACQQASTCCMVGRMIIVVANSKGGVGKSTLAVHLAVWLHEQGHKVILADCDMQHSSSEWAREAAPEMKTVRLSGPDEILDQLPQLEQEADFIVADGPGSNTETSRALLLRADLAVVPCKASMLEVRALAQATKALKHAQDIRKGQPKALIVLSMVGKTYRLTQDMKDAASTLHLRMAKTAITLKQIYADAPGQGTVVWHLGARGREAAQEMRALFREALPEAHAAKTTQRRGKTATG
jgi:chromosome partitioning protein